MCGREIEEGTVCGKCLSERENIAEVDGFEIEMCPRCGFIRIEGRWRDVSMDEALKHHVMRNLKVVEGYGVEEVRIKVDSGGRGYVELTGTLIGDEVSAVVPFTYRVKKQTCVKCSREAGGYYESIVQLRADGRKLEDEEMETAMSIVESVLARGIEDEKMFLSKVEMRKEGVDFYLGGRDAGRKISQMIAKEMGGSVKKSRKIHGRADGRDLYRFTYLVRLPAYRKGDVVVKNDRFYVVKNPRDEKGIDILTGRSVNLSGSKLAVKKGELQGGTIVDVDDSVADVLKDDGELVRTEKPVGGSIGMRVKVFEFGGRHFSFPEDL